MIRSLTFVSALLAGVSGLYLYSEKHRTTLLDQQISRIVADTQQVRERTSMLRAEWALLNQPDRLQQLSGRFLPQLGAMAPTQFVQMASLDARLPAVGPETPPHPIATPETAPSLVGAHPEQPATPATTGAQPDLDGAAIARADAPRQPGRAPALALASATEQQVARSDASPAPTDVAQTAAISATTLAATRLAQAHAKVAARHDVQLAEADTATGDDAARPDVGQQAAMRRVAARPAAHAAHAAAPVRMAYNSGTMATRPAVGAVSSAYARPQVIAAAAWHPAHASWPSARPATYSAPYSAPAPMIGSSLGSSRSSLPAPVPVSDGN